MLKFPTGAPRGAVSQGQWAILCATQSAMTSVGCVFPSNALLAGLVMGLPKKMKLGANKVKGANYRLMLTA